MKMVQQARWQMQRQTIIGMDSNNSDREEKSDKRESDSESLLGGQQYQSIRNKRAKTEKKRCASKESMTYGCENQGNAVFEEMLIQFET